MYHELPIDVSMRLHTMTRVPALKREPTEDLEWLDDGEAELALSEAEEAAEWEAHWRAYAMDRADMFTARLN